MSDDADVLAAVNVANFPDGAPVTLEAILGNSITYGDDGEVVAAEVMMQVGCARAHVGGRHPPAGKCRWRLAPPASLSVSALHARCLSARIFSLVVVGSVCPVWCVDGLLSAGGLNCPLVPTQGDLPRASFGSRQGGVC